MSTKDTNHETAKIVSQPDDQDLADKPALLAPRYLLPALMDGDYARPWPSGKSLATAAAVIILCGLIILYVYGANLATA
jgi:hypothetical protein